MSMEMLKKLIFSYEVIKFSNSIKSNVIWPKVHCEKFNADFSSIERSVYEMKFYEAELSEDFFQYK